MNQSANMPEMAFEHGPHGQFPLDAAQAAHLRGATISPAHMGGIQTSTASPFSAAEFAAFQRHNHEAMSSSSSAGPMSAGPASASASSLQQHRPTLGNVHPMGMGMGMGMGYASMGRPLYQPMFQQQGGVSQEMLDGVVDKGKGKEKILELDDNQWEEQFAKIELENKQVEEDESLAMEPELNKMDEELLESETGFGDFESIWNGIQAGNADMADLTQFWETSNARLGQAPPIEPYMFEEDNIFKDQPNAFEEGMRIMDEGGNLSLAALAFEAAVQADPNHAEAWVQLGSAQAQNEKEDAAIRALERALEIDPNNLAALMALAVSYTNESYDGTSHRTLERWLSVKYPQICPPEKLSSAADLGFTDREELRKRVTNMFLEAARLAPDGQHMDPDVQVGLGVLFYGGDDFSKAVDCFSAALASSEQGTSNQQNQVHLLWNRLGATMANSGRSEEAIHAYEKALAIRPNFVRARYNLGISCINMNCEREAAGHLLAALAMHKEVEKSGRERAREILGGNGSVSEADLERLTTQNRSTTLYDSLRRVFTTLGRRDLCDKVVPGVDPDVFRKDFDF